MAASKEAITRAKHIATAETGTDVYTIMQTHAKNIMSHMPQGDVVISAKENLGTQTDEHGNKKTVGVRVKRTNETASTQPSFDILVYVDKDEAGHLYRPCAITVHALTIALTDLTNIINLDLDTNVQPRDTYKVEMLKRMLAHETDLEKNHYGANLQHAASDTKPLTIDAGGIQALIDYYSTHEANFD